MSKKIKGLIAVALLIIIGAALFTVYSGRNQGTEGSKSYTVEIVSAEGESEVIKASTDKEYLQEALDELAEAGKLSYDGIDQTAGYMIQEINGERAVYEEDSSYWAIYVNGEYGTLGINAQPVTDGDEYKFVHEKF